VPLRAADLWLRDPPRVAPPRKGCGLLGSTDGELQRAAKARSRPGVPRNLGPLAVTRRPRRALPREQFPASPKSWHCHNNVGIRPQAPLVERGQGPPQPQPTALLIRFRFGEVLLKRLNNKELRLTFVGIGVVVLGAWSTSPAALSRDADVVLVGAGDIADCRNFGRSRSHGEAVGSNPRDCRRVRRSWLPQWFSCGLRGLLRPDLGPTPRPHPAKPWQSRISDRPRRWLLRLLGRQGR
jgi:hypothetical protein